MADHTAPPISGPPQPPQPPQPPLLAAVAQAIALLGEATDPATGYDPDWLGPADKTDLVRDLHRLTTMAHALTVRTLAGAGDAADEAAARDPGTWAAMVTRSEFKKGRGDYLLGRRLTRWPAVAAAFGRGQISVDHTRAVLTSLEALPADLEPGQLTRATQHLVELCGRFTPRQVRLLGLKILEVAAPDRAEEHLARLLEAEQRRQAEEQRATLHRRHHGGWRLVADLPDLPGLTLAKILDALASPRRNDPGYDDLDPGQKRGRALCELIERLPADAFPTAGRAPVQTVITLQLDQLLASHGWATLDDGTLVDAGQARIAACRAGVIPAVLGGKSKVLDLGRHHRFASADQVLVMRIENATCQAEGCTVPAAWCDAHHKQPWSQGGGTDLADLALLCGHHHHRAHDPTYTTTWHPTGAVTFHRTHRRT